MVALPLSEVKARLSEIAENVDRTHERVQVTRNGRDYVVLLSAADLASMEATLELLSDPAALRRIQEADAAIEADEGVSVAEMSQLMEQRRSRTETDQDR